jgi:hypothetical protein
MKFVKEHAVLIAVAVFVYFVFFSQSGANAVSALNTTLNVNANGTPAGS